MEEERNEVYERIPWERLEERRGDRNWLAYGVAAAVVLGAVAYTIMSNRPAPIPEVTAPIASETTVVPSEPAPVLPPVASVEPAATPPATSEADLYAVHPERVVDLVAAHAEWFVAEYLTVDGSEQGRVTLAALMPMGVPLPIAPEGTRVFVEWVRATEVVEVAPLTYRVRVLARSLAASGEAAYQRQPPLELVVDVSVAGERPTVLMPPLVGPAPVGDQSQPGLGTVPDQVAAAAIKATEGTEVVGGLQGPGGEWSVVVVVAGTDGVSRPVTTLIP